MINDNDLFTDLYNETAKPLAARLRPTVLTDYIGQQHIIGAGKPLRLAIEQGQIPSTILWGPPGTGKTTLAEIMAASANASVERLSAVTAGVKDIKAAIALAKQRQLQGKVTVLFVDEVHRFNKSQQDAFLPYIEDGTIIFIGATTENPSFELNNALLSRTRVFVLQPLSADDLSNLLTQGLAKLQAQGQSISLTDKARQALIYHASGDGRKLLSILENALTQGAAIQDNTVIDSDKIDEVAGHRAMSFDKQGDAFYDLLSAFHKSVRGSSVDGALYWYARLLQAGGEPLVIARRLLAIASEDIGNADPRALSLCVAAFDTYHRVGAAEGERAIAQAIVYCALAAKSNAVYSAFKRAKALASETGDLPVPMHLRNATNQTAKQLGAGQGYRYAHDEPHAYAAGEVYLPNGLDMPNFYQPSSRGLEKQLREKQVFLTQLDQQNGKNHNE